MRENKGSQDHNDKARWVKEVKAPVVLGALHIGGEFVLRIGEAGTEGTESPANYIQ